MLVYLQALSVLAPGLNGWPQSRTVLSGQESYTASELPPFPKHLLPPNEQRRATPTMKLVLQVAADVLTEQNGPRRELCSVFASSGGDSDVIHRICSALTLPERPVSPTHFHNSVHNAPAGYWSISRRCQQSYTAISAYDASFSAGLLEAAVTALTEQTAVLLVAYDRPLPSPLAAVRTLTTPFAVALLLSPEASDGLAEFSLNIDNGPGETTLSHPALEQMRCSNPAARSLPVLAAIARDAADTVILPYLGNARLRLGIRVMHDNL